MISKMYAIYDSKVEAYMTPFNMQTNGAAIRVFTDLANDKNSMVGKHPEDFSLFVIGEWDDQKGKLIAASTPQSMGLAKEFVRSGSIDIPRIMHQPELVK